MTRQHFQAIAETLRALKPDRGNKYASRALQTKGAAAYGQWESAVVAMADMCARSNPAFNRARFYTACGIGE